MIKDNTFTFFDAEDFEVIIEYYFQSRLKDKASKALRLA